MLYACWVGIDGLVAGGVALSKARLLTGQSRNGIGGGGLLPSDAHPEIIQRSKPILKMLAKKGKLTARDIDTVWGTAERAGSHASSLMGAVYVEVEQLVMGRRE